MNKDYILIIFDTNKIITKDIIENSHGLNHTFCKIITMNDFLSDVSVISKYKAIIDCSTQNKLYNNFLSKKNGVEFTENGFCYIKTARNNFVTKGPNISRLTSTLFNKSEQIVANYKKDYSEYLSIINFIISKIPELRNKQSFEKAIKTDEIILDYELVGKPMKSKYVLVKNIPEIKEQGTEYITYDDIFILNELKNIIEYIK